MVVDCSTQNALMEMGDFMKHLQYILQQARIKLLLKSVV